MYSPNPNKIASMCGRHGISVPRVGSAAKDRSMLKTAAVVPTDQHFILSTLSPSATQKRLALAIVLGILVVYFLIIAGPLQGARPGRLDAFIPAYVTAMFVFDSITAILLYAQFSILRSRAILVIASGYLFTALMLIPYILVFPGVFVAGNLIGGRQSTSWVYFLAHAIFPLFVIAYSLLKDANPNKQIWEGTPRAAIVRSVALTAAVVSVLGFICIAGEAQLPRVTLDSTHLSALWPYVGASVASFSIAAIAVLWVRGRSALDLWLMVVLFLIFMDKPLSYYPDPTRFSVGWYAVRAFVFLSSTLVLIVLLYEIGTLYSRLVGALQAQRREREARLMTGDAVAATIAHEVTQPVTAMVTSADAGLRFLDRSMPNLDKAKEAFERIVADGHRAGAVIRNIRATFKNDAPDKVSLDMNELIQEVLALTRGDLLKHRVLVQAEPTRSLPAVRGDRVQLQQVLLNLITNAIDAMAAREEPRVLCVKCGAHEQAGVVVSVADTGTGIGSQDADRIFNPLFTTKTDGMGMGLSICRSIIEAHDGRLWVSPNTPQGSVFRFTLQANYSMSASA
jgi:signal transduction histidine kinase